MAKKLKIPWASMSIEDKRRTIARDALYQIQRGTLIPKQGSYVSVIKGINKLREKKGDSPYSFMNYLPVQVNEVLCDIKCGVCAKGALFLGHVNRFNKLKSNPDSLYNIIPSDETNNINRRLRPIFGNLQMDMIECAFEKRVVTNRSKKLRTEYNNIYRQDHNTVLGDICITYGKKYRGASDRLIAILQNIIKNGKFKP